MTEIATPTQRLLAARYAEIHRKFFPRPPTFPMLQPEQTPPAPNDQEPETVPALPLIPQRATKLVSFNETKARMRIIRRCVAKAFDVTIEDMLGDRRASDVVLPRHVYCYMVARLTKASLPMIGRSLDKDHTTILHAVRRIQRKVGAEHHFSDRLAQLERLIRAELGEYSKPRGCVGRYVAHRDVADYLLLGWMWAANMNDYAALLIWPCDCHYVEPRQ